MQMIDAAVAAEQLNQVQLQQRQGPGMRALCFMGVAQSLRPVYSREAFEQSAADSRP
ncbi:hypothetical protein [Pseudoxanthomonas suwonensis]|uniref:hypothetical protein n=1 Tax=Pseudoxanthomonas suwonensis TaxID=314722 RepID=UPI00139642D2|nr:hypothetical protein [Pseudoxanthomonas suwonensis]